MTYYREKTHTDKMPAETLWIRDLDLPDGVILPYKRIRGVVPATVCYVRTYAELTPAEVVA